MLANITIHELKLLNEVWLHVGCGQIFHLKTCVKLFLSQWEIVWGLKWRETSWQTSTIHLWLNSIMVSKCDVCFMVHCNILSFHFPFFKGKVYPEIVIISFFHCHVIPNPYDSMELKRRDSGGWTGPFFPMQFQWIWTPEAPLKNPKSSPFQDSKSHTIALCGEHNKK